MAYKGLKAILDETNRRQQASASAVPWLKLEEGKVVKIRFINELDADSPAYDPARGLAVAVDEHVDPNDFRRKIACTKDELGRCWACEQAQRDPKGRWYSKMRFYINVLVDDGKQPPHVAVWSMATRRSATFDTIKEYYFEAGQLSQTTWRLKKSGSGTDTVYSLLPLGADSVPFDWTGIEPFDLDNIVKTLPYEEQEAYFGVAKPEEAVDGEAW